MNFRSSAVALLFFALSSAFLPSGLLAQPLLSRSGAPTPAPETALRTFPCAGNATFTEDFSSALAGAAPLGWKTVNFNLPEPATDMVNAGYVNGWHSRSSFKEASNTAMASLSYFSDTTAHANNWLISPPVTVGANTCFSWYGYSQDVYYPERYVVRVSKTAPTDSTPFESIFTFKDTVVGEAYAVNYRSLPLTNWINNDSTDTLRAGDMVYIAFQHISKNKFFLVLDDIRITEVLARDAGSLTPEPVYITEAGEAAFFTYTLRNYGSDSINLDTINLHYRINGGRIITQRKVDSIRLAPNDTTHIFCDSSWTQADTAAYQIEMWASGFVDENAANDTARGVIYIGFATSVTPPSVSRGFTLSPNPSKDGQVFISMDIPSAEILTVTVSDLTGRQLLRESLSGAGLQDSPLDISQLQKGLYLVSVQRAGQAPQVCRLMVE